jgi:hypothetical protein
VTLAPDPWAVVDATIAEFAVGSPAPGDEQDWDRAERQLLPPEPDPYADDPAGWVKDRIGDYLWSKQVEIAEAVKVHRKVAVKACHGPGKSFLAGRIVGWWIDTHPIGEAFAVTTAPTDPQVKAILWREITRAHKKGGLPGRVTQDAQWKIDDELVAFGRKPADHDENGFQGIHDRYLLAVLDEACGIPLSIWTGVAALLTNDDARALAVGNPDNPATEFGAICKGAPEDGSSGLSDQGWWVITISLFDTPNFTGETIPESLRPSLPGPLYLEDAEQRWGVDSPLYVSKILGRFPEDAQDGVVPWSWLRQCQGEEIAGRLGALRIPAELGVDVGGSDEGDETVIMCRQGPRFRPEPWRIRSSDSEKIVDQVIEAVREVHATSVKVDSIGVGFGVVGSLRRRLPAEVRWDVDVHAVNVAVAASQPDKFVNLRAEIWWEIGREYSRLGTWDLSDLDDDVLAELSAPKFREVNGKIQVEAKDEIRKRLGRSPDSADAVLLAAYQAPPPATAETSKPRDERLRRRAGR